MTFIGNIIWFVFGGFIHALGWFYQVYSGLLPLSEFPMVGSVLRWLNYSWRLLGKRW